jgi:FecR protein
MRLRPLVFLALAGSLLPHASAQSVISARSGLVNYFEGEVFLDGQPVASKPGIYVKLKPGSTLMTADGRAEVLLTPNTYFRIGEKSTMRMLSDSLSDTRVELMAGSASVDSASAPAGDFVKIVFKDSTIRILKPGRYRIDAEPAQFRVFEGEADVARGGDSTKIESAQLMPLDGAPVVKRFTQGSDGLLDIWADERSALIGDKMVSSQAITDPLTDNGPDLSADLTAPLGPYAGYIPLAGAPTIVGGGYAYGGAYGYGHYGLGLGYNSYGLGFAPVYMGGIYPGFRVPAYATYPRPLGLTNPRYGGTSIFAGRPVPSSGITVPRPGSTFGGVRAAPSAPHVGFHPVGRR